MAPWRRRQHQTRTGRRGRGESASARRRLAGCSADSWRQGAAQARGRARGGVAEADDGRGRAARVRRTEGTGELGESLGRQPLASWPLGYMGWAENAGV